MKKLLALLLSGFCVLSVAACVQDGDADKSSSESESVSESSVSAGGGESSSSSGKENETEQTELQKIKAFLKNTSDAKDAALIYEIAMSHQGIEIDGEFALVNQSYDTDHQPIAGVYEKADETIKGQVSREGLAADSKYKAYLSYAGTKYYDDGSRLYIPKLSAKYDSLGIQGMLSLFSSTWCANAKETFAMNDSLSEDILEQIGTTYSMTTAGDITTITYSASSAEQTMEGVELTDSAKVTSTWKFDKNYRCIEYTETYTSVYKSEVASSAGRRNGSQSYSVKAWSGTVTMPSNTENYYYMGSFMS